MFPSQIQYCIHCQKLEAYDASVGTCRCYGWRERLRKREEDWQNKPKIKAVRCEAKPQTVAQVAAAIRDDVGKMWSIVDTLYRAEFNGPLARAREKLKQVERLAKGLKSMQDSLDELSQ